MELNRVSLEYEDEPNFLVMRRDALDCRDTYLHRPPRSSVASDWDRKQVRKLHRQGRSVNYISKHLALTEGAVTKALK